MNTNRTARIPTYSRDPRSATSATCLISMTRMTWVSYSRPVLRVSATRFFERWTYSIS